MSSATQQQTANPAMTDGRRLVVAVTGASSGVGRATAQAFARKGAAVGLIARGVDALRATEAEVVSLGATSARRRPPTSRTRRRSSDAAEAIERELGPIDVWVNNAMATRVRAGERDLPGGVSPGHGSHLSRGGVRHSVRAEADAPAASAA